MYSIYYSRHIIGDSHRLIPKSNDHYLLRERETLLRFRMHFLYFFQSHSLFNEVIVRDIETNYHNFNTKSYYISKLMKSNDGNSKLIFKIFTSIFQ